MPLHFIICHLCTLVANHKPTGNCVCTHSYSRNTIGQCLLYNWSHTAVSSVLYAVDILDNQNSLSQMQTWPCLLLLFIVYCEVEVCSCIKPKTRYCEVQPVIYTLIDH